MNTLHEGRATPFGRDETVAVCIKQIAEVDGLMIRHTGFLFQSSSDEKARFAHLAWHGDECYDDVDPAYLWSPLAMSAINRQVVAAWLSSRVRNPADISYGFTVEGSCFDENGKFIPQPPGKGLTCATYVHAILRHLGFEVVDLSSWPSREEDKVWQRFIISQMAVKKANEAHADALRNDVGAIRLKPSEIVGCASTVNPSWPISFQDAQQAASTVESALS